MKNKAVFSVIALVLSTLGCKSRTFNSTVRSDGDQWLKSNASVEWRPCVFPDIDATPLPAGVSVDCATYHVPVKWDDSKSRSIDLLVRRLRPSDRTSVRSQVWYSMGGPGQRGNIAVSLYAETVATNPWLEFYIPDQRGIGRSTKLGCGVPFDLLNLSILTKSDFDSCVEKVVNEWGEDLKGFSVDNSARDAIFGRNLNRKSGARWFFQGQSYGTYLTNAIMTREPSGADAFVMTGYSPGGWVFEQKAKNARLVVSEILRELCSKNDTCLTKLGSEPMAVVAEALAKVDSGACVMEGKSDSRNMKTLFVEMARLRGPVVGLLPVVAYRMRRCNSKDKAFLSFLRNAFVKKPTDLSSLPKFDASKFDPSKVTPEAELSGWFLQQYLIFSELFLPRPFPSDEQLKLSLSTEPFANPGDEDIALGRGFPKYDFKAPKEPLARTTKPVLILHGTHDWETPVAGARAAAKIYNAPHQHVVEVLEGTHGVERSGPLSSSGQTCSSVALLAFWKDPSAALDLSCFVSAKLSASVPGALDALPPDFGLVDSIWGD